MTPDYKAQKEASVSNLRGGGIWEINIITLTAPAAAFLWAVLQTRQSFFKPYTIPAYLTDFLLQCCAILFATTAYAGSPQTLIGLLAVPALASFLQPKAKSSVSAAKPKSNDDESKETKTTLPIKPFITTYRGAMMIITCTSILAVDFNIFPRRFAKTESLGTSLMDMGVGSFVFASGIVAARQQLRDQSSKGGFLTRMRSAMRHSLPLVILGLVRLGMVKGLDYAEHVSEYGVHWNFFFTLALLSPVMAILDPIFRWIPSYGILAFAIGIAYELFLFFTPGIKQYIIFSPRIEGDWLSQNREGVFSFIGYFAIFVAGMGAGQGILPRDVDSNNPFQLPQIPAKAAVEKDDLDQDDEWLASVLGASSTEAVATEEEQAAARRKAEEQIAAIKAPQIRPDWPKTAFFHLVKWAGLWFVFSVWALWRYGPGLFVSRRMANLGYVCWVCAFNMAQLLLFCGIEVVMFPDLYEGKDDEEERQRAKEATSKVLNAFNRNGLALFLLANLLTGAVNLALPTLYLGDVEAMAVLVSYIAIIATVGIVLDKYDISIKL